MLNVLLSFTNPSPEAIRLCLYYGVCLLLIVIALSVIAIFKRRTKGQLRSETVKKACLKAKRFAQKLVIEQKKHNKKSVLVSTKLNSLSGYVADAAWYGFQIVDAKKDIVFEGIANGIDTLATDVSKTAELGYISAEEYLECINKTIAGLDAALEKIEHAKNNA
ncbi:MAG: hypothetical protein IJX49_06585 [Clostridia bacterium]|nr:hypothetical protein [Clostridia bacterium]